MTEAENAEPTTETISAKGQAGPKETGVRFDVAGLRVALAKAAGVPTVSRPALAKLIGAHPNSIALWESGKLVGTKFDDKLRELDEKIAKGEKIELVAKKKGGRPKKATTAKRKSKPKESDPLAGGLRGLKAREIQKLRDEGKVDLADVARLRPDLFETPEIAARLAATDLDESP